MRYSSQDQTWGFHLNKTVYSSSTCPPCPMWASSWEQQNWAKLGVVVWDARINRVTHIRGSQAVSILEQSRQSKSWKKKGLLVGEVAYRITLPSTEKSKKKTKDQEASQPLQEDGWCLTYTIQLAPNQARQFVSFLEQHEATLQKIVDAETAERREVLGQVYSLILSWGEERKKKIASPDKSEVVQERNAVPNDAVSIPQGKYFTKHK